MKIYRLFFALVGWLVIFYSFFSDFNHLVDFLSYFTIQSNLLIICWFTLAVLANPRGRIGALIRHHRLVPGSARGQGRT
ncbi:MAG: hypothetical protein ABID35_04505 [Candidatus Margulisiibacteriota bacterium]